MVFKSCNLISKLNVEFAVRDFAEKLRYPDKTVQTVLKSSQLREGEKSRVKANYYCDLPREVSED